MSVYIILDNSKACYDCGGIFYGVYFSLEEAKESLSGFDRRDRADFSIIDEFGNDVEDENVE